MTNKEIDKHFAAFLTYNIRGCITGAKGSVEMLAKHNLQLSDDEKNQLLAISINYMQFIDFATRYLSDWMRLECYGINAINDRVELVAFLQKIQIFWQDKLSECTITFTQQLDCLVNIHLSHLDFIVESIFFYMYDQVREDLHVAIELYPDNQQACIGFKLTRSGRQLPPQFNQLSLCQSIAEVYGGSFLFQHAAQHAIFTIRLPFISDHP